MNYTAVIEIDDDRWCKHPYGIKILDEDENVVKYANFLDDRKACYRVAAEYGINPGDIEEEFY